MLRAVSERPKLQPRQVAPYFIIVALIHVASVATRSTWSPRRSRAPRSR
jgi:hypothetical protein